VVWQTGSGTQSNMNANEVIANRAIELAGAAAGLEAPGAPQRRRQPLAVIERRLPHRDARRRGRRNSPAASSPRSRPCARPSKSARSPSATIVKIGRTHLMDATPLTLGQEFSGYAAQLGFAERQHLKQALDGTVRARPRRQRRRHRPQHPPPLRRGRRRARLAALTGCPSAPRPTSSPRSPPTTPSWR
jgi:hypothetical protein